MIKPAPLKLDWLKLENKKIHMSLFYAICTDYSNVAMATEDTHWERSKRQMERYLDAECEDGDNDLEDECERQLPHG